MSFWQVKGNGCEAYELAEKNDDGTLWKRSIGKFFVCHLFAFFCVAADLSWLIGRTRVTGDRIFCDIVILLPIFFKKYFQEAIGKSEVYAGLEFCKELLSVLEDALAGKKRYKSVVSLSEMSSGDPRAKRERKDCHNLSEVPF